jgi:hypothetical protein
MRSGFSLIMNKWTLLLLVGALAAVAMLNKDKISAMLGGKSGDVAEATPAPVTPHPSPDYVTAKKAYPALNIANSPFNKKFVELYNNAKVANPALLAQVDWPMKISQQVAQILGPVPMAGGAPPTEASASQLNGRPPGSAPGYTVPPSVQLPGLKGSALDQRPPGRQR